MITIEIIATTILIAIVFIYFLQLFNSNFLKERKSILDRLGIYQQYSTALPKDVELRDNGLKQDAKRYHTAWHKWKVYVCGCFVFLQSILILFIFQYPLKAVISGFVSIFVIWSVGDMILNKLMKWNIFERGDKSVFDKVPFWVRFIGLGIVIGLMFLI